MSRRAALATLAVVACTCSANAPARSLPRLRFGIDPGIAGSVGGSQQAAVPDQPMRDLRALRRLRPRGKALVLRLGRLFLSDGERGINRFVSQATTDTRAGFEVEIQVRYHPSPAQAGDLGVWRAFVRRVVDALGPNRRVVAMTITNEVNVAVSPNTSDGAYPRAKDALIDGIEAAHGEAARRHFTQLRFGFTYAYRFAGDPAFFTYLGAHGGQAFRRAVDFVGLDFYPGTIAPPVLAPGESYRTAFAQAAATVRRRLMPRARLSGRIPLWITENGVPTGSLSDRGQAAALGQLVRAAQAFSATFNITDYRWFNLRDSIPAPPPGIARPIFAFDGLLRADYSTKPAFATYRGLIVRYGVAALGVRNVTARR